MAEGMVDLLLRGGAVVNHDGVRTADVAIHQGVVVGLFAPGSELTAAETIDLSGKHLFPGVIDPHAHVSNNRPISESFARETPSLALGGTTTLIDMLATEHSYRTLADEAIAEVQTGSQVDVAFHAVFMTEEHLAELPSYIERYGITSFKVYMGAGGTRLYPLTLGIDDGLLFRMLRTAAQIGPRVRPVVHAENWEIARALTAEVQASGRTDAAAWTEARPNICEVDCLWRLANLLQATEAKAYVVHLSTQQAPEILRTVRARGVEMYGETCPHYLMMHRDHPRAIVAKYNPAVKTTADNEALWQAVADGTINSIGSDHIPVRKADKEPGQESIWTARGGAPGSGTILPLLLSEGIGKRGIAPERVAAVSSYNTARIFGLYPRKGAIAVGSDADIVVADLNRKVTVRPELLQLDFTLFDGEEFSGWPEMTILRGRVIARDGQVVGKPGDGSYLPRSA
jgi:dihydropyrimidinase